MRQLFITRFISSSHSLPTLRCSVAVAFLLLASTFFHLSPIVLCYISILFSPLLPFGEWNAVVRRAAKLTNYISICLKLTNRLEVSSCWELQFEYFTPQSGKPTVRATVCHSSVFELWNLCANANAEKNPSTLLAKQAVLRPSLSVALSSMPFGVSCCSHLKGTEICHNRWGVNFMWNKLFYCEFQADCFTPKIMSVCTSI